MSILFIPVGVPTFHMESASEQFTNSLSLLNRLAEDIISPEKPILGVDELRTFLKGKNPDLVIYQNTTFANSAYAAEVVNGTNCPLVLWTLCEPVTECGGRLRLNSLTGAYSAANLFTHAGRKNFEYIFGSPLEKSTGEKLSACIKAASLKMKMKGMNIAAVGHTPQGFGFGRGLDAEFLKNFGINIISVEARELIAEAKKCAPRDYAGFKQTADKRLNMDGTPEENRQDFYKLYKAYSDFAAKVDVSAMASRCWPDFFVDFGTPVCAVLGMLNDDNIPVSCEADLLGALCMYIGKELTGSAVFFGDPVSVCAEENTVTYWHCGTAACSLARKEEAGTVGVHPNRKIGPTMEFGCKPSEKVTVFRMGRNPDATFRFFITKGEALDKPKQFLGTSIVVKTCSDAVQLVEKSVKDGWEPHFTVIYGDVSHELEVLANFLGMEVFHY